MAMHSDFQPKNRSETFMNKFTGPFLEFSRRIHVEQHVASPRLDGPVQTWDSIAMLNSGR